MKQFNYVLSSQRITVEHAFGQLKGQFQSLQFLGAHRDIKEMYEVIETLIILHNMCIFHQDRPQDIIDMIIGSPDLIRDEEGFDGVQINGDPNLPAYETEAWLQREGYKMRLDILNRVFPADA